MGDTASEANAGGKAKPLLFLSHAGDDYEVVAELKRRIEESEEARQAGLTVWLDKTHMGGGAWQPQLESAIARSTAFVVYIGSHGIVNWVEAEVRAALDRAIKDKGYPFIPIFAGKKFDPNALPMFARSFQVMANPQKPEDFATLIGWILAKSPDGPPVKLEREPFFGLNVIDERRDHLFFGREKETAELVEKLRNQALVLVSGDSGCGKSSLVRAGLVRSFRGRALLSHDQDPQRDIIYHAVITRPGVDPWRLLGESVEQVAKQMGCSPADQELYAGFARNRDNFYQVRRGLRCHLTSSLVRILLVVDQFEELFTLTPESERHRFVDFLLSLVKPADPSFRVVLTMRQDYVHLTSAFPELAALFDADDGGGRFDLGRMSDAGLREIVARPLSLGGINDESEHESLANAVLEDMAQRPGDLALVQMALSETWRLRDEYHGQLQRAYSDSVHLEKVLAAAAESFRQRLASDRQRSAFDDTLIRLIHIGDDGRATRRTAARDEFDDEKWSILQTLASADCKRCVLIAGSERMLTAEIWHEKLVAAWPHLHDLLYSSGKHKLALDDLIPRAKEWIANKRGAAYLATGASVGMFRRLAAERAGWLSQEEVDFVEASARLAWIKRLAGIAAITSAILFAVILFRQGYKLKERGRTLESRGLAERALAVAQTDPERGLLIAIDADKKKPTRQAKNALREILAQWRLRRRLKHASPVQSVAFSPDGALLVTTAGTTAQLWDAKDAKHDKPLEKLEREGGPFTAAAFSPTSDLVISASKDGRVQLWGRNDTQPRELVDNEHRAEIRSVALAPGDGFAASGSVDGKALIWNLDTGKVERVLQHKWAVVSVEFAEGEKKLVTASGLHGWLWDIAEKSKTPTPFPHGNRVKSATISGPYMMTAGGKSVSIWDLKKADQGAPHPPDLSIHTEEIIRSAALDANGDAVVAALANQSAMMWRADSGKQITRFIGHTDNINAVAISPDGHLVATASDDQTARVWTASPESLLPIETRKKFDKEIDKAKFSPRDSLIAIASGFQVELIDAQNSPAPVEENGKVHDVEFNSSGEWMATVTLNGIAVWSVASGQQLVLLPFAEDEEDDDEALGARFNGAGDRLLAWSPKAVAVWDIAATASAPADGEPAEVPQARRATFDSRVIAAAFVVGASDIAIVTESELVIWNPQQNTRRETRQASSEAAFNCAGESGADRCGSTVVATVDAKGVTVRKLVGGDWQTQFTHPATHAVLSSDGALAAALQPRQAEILSVGTGARLHRVDAKNTIRVAAFSPDRRLLVVGGSDGYVDVWVTETGDRATDFEAGNEDIVEVGFAAKSRFLMTASEKELHIYRPERFVPVEQIRARAAARAHTLEEQAER